MNVFMKNYPRVQICITGYETFICYNLLTSHLRLHSASFIGTFIYQSLRKGLS